MSIGGPATIWRPSDGNGEFTSQAALNIVDPLGVFLVAPDAVFIVSPLSEFTQLAATEWLENNSI